MRNTILLLPFALPPAEHAKDLLAALNTPSLALLLARGSEAPPHEQPPFSASLAHESLLAGTDASNSPPLAHALMSVLGLPPTDGHWFVLQPAHFHIARDHLVLTDLRALDLDDDASHTLFASIGPLFDESGYALRYGDARHWFLRADDWRSLRTTTPDAATGHNIDVWLPSGEAARSWRKLHNEVQMLWHTHPLNEVREGHGMPRVNALWLWGGANAVTDVPLERARLLTGIDTTTESDAWHCDPALLPAALAGDWSRWLQSMQAIDAGRIAQLLASLRAGSIDRLTLQLTDASRVRTWYLTRHGMRKFWRQPSLSALAS